MLLSLVLVVVGLALINGALANLSREWLPGPLADVFGTIDAYVGSEGSAVGGVFGLGLLVAALSPLGNRLLVNLAILGGLATVGVLVGRYYAGRLDVVPPIVFWVAATALMMAFYPTHPRPVESRPPLRPAAGSTPGAAPTTPVRSRELGQPPPRISPPSR